MVNSLNEMERRTLHLLPANSQPLMLGYAVEYAAKRLPDFKGYLTDIVCNILCPEHGRSGEASVGPVAIVPKDVLARELAEMRERDRLKRFALENPMNQAEKRGPIDESNEANSDATLESDAQSPPSTNASKMKLKTKVAADKVAITI